jgi:hypothetical protein
MPKKITSSAFSVNIFIAKASLHVTTGTSQLKTYAHPHETGFPVAVYFCGNCTTMLYKEGGTPKYQDYYVVQAGTLDKRDGEGREVGGLDAVTPEDEYWTMYRAGWLGKVSGLKQFQGFA